MPKPTFLLLALLMAMPTYAANAQQVPEQLQPWQGWVLHKHPQLRCPHTQAAKGDTPSRARPTTSRHCIWPGRLSIQIDAKGASFTQSWQIYGNKAQGEHWLPLPGNPLHWPTEVTLNGQPVTALDKAGLPALRAGPGSHQVNGRLHWQQQPQSLQLPPHTALVNVTIDGTTIPWPAVDDQHILWLQRDGSAGADNENSVKVEVFRRIQDGIPIIMDTELRLLVSGKPRELQLGRLLLAGNEVTHFTSPLPARIEKDGSLRIQVRAGGWQVKVTSRLTGNPPTMAMQKSTQGWPQQEIWSFSLAPNHRGLKISGAPAMDPSMLDLPQGWQHLPTYLLEPGATLRLEQQYRGDPSPIPSAEPPYLTRRVWLDFDGSGATVIDKITGTLNQSQRLSVQPMMALGRVTVNGYPQLVTRMDEASPPGVEVRDKRFNLQAVSRLADWRTLTASGWQLDFEAVSMQLNLPPGWLLWHVAGSDFDYVGHSWLSRWDLWDLFFCLLVAAAAYGLLGWRYAILAAVTLVLISHEPNAPLLLWVALIILLPLLQLLPAGRTRKLTTGLSYLTLLLLAVTSLLFAAQQLRASLYPHVDQPRAAIESGWPTIHSRHIFLRGTIWSGEGVLKHLRRAFLGKEMPVSVLGAGSPQSEQLEVEEVALTSQRYQPGDNIQTGPAEPQWDWSRSSIEWHSSVTPDTPLSLYISPPWLTRSVLFIQALLLLALLVGFARRLFQLSRPWGASGEGSAPVGAKGTAAAVILVCGLSGMASQEAEAQDFPPSHLLQELETRLTAPAPCAPDCLGVDAVQVTVQGSALSLRMRVAAGTHLAMPLPFDKTWQAKRLLLNGAAHDSLLRAGKQLWLDLPAGNHDILIQAQVNGDAINLPFSQSPHNVTVSAPDWDMFGLVENRIPGRSLQLQKRQQTLTQETLLLGPVAPFVKVNRRLQMGLDWQLVTTVERIAPQQGGISAQVSLLPGESVVQEQADIVEEDGRRFITITLGANQDKAEWRSVLPPSSAISLHADESPFYVETWAIQATPRWHLDYAGLIPVKSDDAVPLWLPWPGESLNVQVSRPEAVPGPTTTVDRVTVTHHPSGEHSSYLLLDLQIRTSLGGDFRIQLPQNARVVNAFVNHEELASPQDAGALVVPLHPGKQRVFVGLLVPEGAGLLTSLPEVGLSSPANNIYLQLDIPSSRWPLLVGGPAMGPAVLYWSLLLLALLVAAALGWLIKQRNLNVPVTTWQWMLLALGMSTINILGGIAVAAWFFTMEARARLAPTQTRWKFNLMQLALIFLTIAALVSLLTTVSQGLEHTPNMQIATPFSDRLDFTWYQDSSGLLLPQAYVISLPTQAYNLAMLAWSLWLAFALLRWAKWGWHCYSKEHLWLPRPPKKQKK